MRLLIAFILTGLPLLAGAQVPTPMPIYQTDWNKADSLAAEGLPKSALAVVDQIYARAKATRNYPQVAKAAMHRMAYRTFSDEADFAAQIRSIQQELTDTPEHARSVLQSVLAETYWRYYQQNRYKFYDRTAVKPAPTDKPAADDDPRTWGARRLFAAIATAYEASLRNVALLQKTPLTAYDVILNRGDADTRALRPTLYDVLAHRAISYFQNTEPDIIKPVFRFSLDQATYLAGPEIFSTLPLSTRDSLSGRFHALQLYQQLIQQHLTDKDPLALADVDNLRLQFVHQYSVVPDKDSLYEQTLEQQIARYAGKSPAEADYLYQLSLYLAGQGDQYRPLAGPAHKTDRQRAATLARDLMQRYPSTLAGRNAERVLKRLMSQILTIQAEEVTEPDKPFRARVTYRNIATIFYRLYKLPVEAWHTRYDNISYGDTAQQRAVYRKLLTYSLAAQGQTALPDDGDLQTHTIEMPVQGVPLGHYILLVSTDGQFAVKADQLGITPITVSQLGYLSHKDESENTQTLYVTDRQTGQPLTGVQVTLVTESGRTTATVRNLVGPNDKTDANGRIDLSRAQLPSEGAYWFRLTRGTDILETDQEYIYRYNRGNQPPKEANETKAVFFTDRAIYRPGQTIYFKGLVYSGKANSFSVVAGQETDVFLLDVNSEEVGKMTLTTNEFGTIAGTFTAPTGRLTGEMTIGSINGRTTIRVEEYKRPTFAVTVEPNKKSFKLEQTVTLSAVAKTLAGAVVDGAQVRYRVTRSYYRPYWEYWRKQPYRNSPTAEIANGDAKTDDKGVVQITFPATTDRDIPASENPRFTFAVTLDVTDRAGETRSATQTLRIGYSALQAELTIPPQVGRGDATAYAVRVSNQSGEVVPVKTTTITISRLQAPDRSLRKRLWERPDRQLLTREAFIRLFPTTFTIPKMTRLPGPLPPLKPQPTATSAWPT